MRVVHINYDGAGWGGASIAMLRIHEDAKARGNESIIACRVRAENNDAICLCVKPIKRVIGFTKMVLMKVLYGHVFRSGLIKTGMADFVNSLRPEKIVLHWFHIDTIALKEIPSLRGEIEWWLHDLWPMSGIDPYPTTDWFKVGPPRENLISRHSWNLKRKVVEKIKDRLTVIGPSQWACSQARQSKVFQGAKIVYRPYPCDRTFLLEAHKATHVVRDRSHFIVLFGAVGGTRNPVKGFDRLVAAIGMLSDEERDLIQVNVFGQDCVDRRLDNVRVHYLGCLEGAKELVHAYKCADVFAFPSRYETWGQVKSEALLCGLPVIAFDESACAEGITHGVNGWIAGRDDIQGYAEGLSFFIARKMGK